MLQFYIHINMLVSEAVVMNMSEPLLNSVSYTHLDVYKRQEQERERQGERERGSYLRTCHFVT